MKGLFLASMANLVIPLIVLSYMVRGRMVESPDKGVESERLESTVFERNLMFGMGLGVGVIVSQTICNSLLEMAEPEPNMTDKLRRQVYDALSHVLTPSMLRQVQNYTS